jgi:acetylornithine deacetylase/succinyl-diaminopimelate desuccinylase-like protein
MAGPTINELPQTAYADVDCRLLPGENPKRFMETIRKVIADKSIKIQVLLTSPATSSPQKSSLMRAIERLAREDKARSVPTMISGFTDSRFFRHHGVISYGFIPIELSAADERGIHGVNEHIGVSQLGDAIRRMVTLLEIFGGRG